MESVVATVSGYHGSERFNLIKLISHAGASYVGALSRSTTHLVCWRFEGKKYDFAKKFNTIIVNHRWVEECIKQGKRVPEHPYIQESGEEVGPLLLEILPVNVGLRTKNRKMLTDKLNVCDYSKKQTTDLACGVSGLAAWTESCLLNKSLFPDSQKSNDASHKSKHKLVKKASMKENKSSSRYCLEEPPLSGLLMQHGESSSHSSKHPVKDWRKIFNGNGKSSFHSSKHPDKDKRKIFNGYGSNMSSEPSCKGRRLLKKNVGIDMLESAHLESDQECYPISVHNLHNNVAALPNYSDGIQNANRLKIGGTSDDQFHNQVGTTNESSETSKDSNLCVKHPSTAMGRTSEQGCTNDEDLKEEIEDETQIEHLTRLPTSTELSCVICWTDFSSTRGVLPCGHRFCFSCIQNWADHMASRRKISTCPLCKASFVSITKVEDAATTDQKIYSQTIPCAPSDLDIFILTDQETRTFGAQSLLAPTCSACRCQEPEDLLISCHLCQIRRIHSYCLDPPLLPWTCMHCRDLQMLYHHTC
ncbi:uncharacterized protein LOC132182293 isoform X1 [Corylus avellana]|uniref:uncharacterized protein LOC132182293 isoform X1 n=1 Tax=Corylus avellana TaxID=13451 RepID=UPI00286A6549|nr:uncharacterized protein LOC132182293 isoform X1 [Corylus avellana]XP_059451475.1 uncharacterized protein LOC132182293 isoform X1 [Corylus avellana]XP_059451476.1 uncharacterized protein LOC132182293 isoform X1 [Corylus avellana]XP_059451477.1 uncharacterized protein LOC132182293 isoform X1 [Corylus avellana]